MNCNSLLIRTVSAGIACSVLPCAGAPPAQSDYIKSSNAASFDHFGQSVAMSGDTMVVGAWQKAHRRYAARPGCRVAVLSACPC